MVRRLEKIEKEMGYCEIKLEKERRLRKQREFLQADIEALSNFMKLYESSDMGLRSLPYAKIAQQLALERNCSDKPGRFFHRAKEDFIAAGVLEMVREDRELLRRECGNIDLKLSSFTGFTQKRSVLEEERKAALNSMAPNHSSKIRKLNDEFKRIERQWNSLTEDLLNLDEAVFRLARNTDYIKSARSFLITAKGNFDIEGWVDGGYTSDLFRHSNIGRSKEMFDGANRNLKMAQLEICCVANVKVQIGGFEQVLVEFLDGLFDDIFLAGRLGRSIAVAEDAAVKSEKLLKQIRDKRDALHLKLEQAEENRAQLFQRLGGDKGRKMSLS